MNSNLVHIVNEPFVGVAIGFVVACVGGAARAYMDWSANGDRMFHDLWRGNTELSYWKLIKKHYAPVWPLLLCVVCVPLGVVIMVSSIIWIR